MTEVIEGLPTLAGGSHSPNEGKACVMEYVALLAGEAWTDRPTCTHPDLTSAAHSANDNTADEDRHLLVPLIGRLFGTSAPEDREEALELHRKLSEFYYDTLVMAPGWTWAGWLEGVIDEYDRLTGRTTHRHVSDAELAVLSARVSA